MTDDSIKVAVVLEAVHTREGPISKLKARSFMQGSSSMAEEGLHQSTLKRHSGTSLKYNSGPVILHQVTPWYFLARNKDMLTLMRLGVKK